LPRSENAVISPAVRLVAAAIAALALLAAPAGAAVFVIDGHGWGHGVGMSQWGAEGYALHGWSYRQILAHYYPGTRLVHEPPVKVRVLLAVAQGAVTIGSKQPYRLTDGRGRSRILPAGRRRFVGGKLPLRFTAGATPLSFDGAGYRGALIVRGSRRHLLVVNELPLERYLRGVVGWEMPHRWSAQALDVQAVAARSYALAALRGGRVFDLYPDTRDQEYGGIRAETPQTNAAVGATAGEILTWDDRPALTFYSSTSGGRTAAGPDAIPWAPRVPYLRSVSDPYDSLSPHHDWGPYTFRAARLSQLLDLPGVKRLALVRNGSNRVATVWVRWRHGVEAIPGRTFVRELGLPSTWFTVRGARTDQAAARSVAASRAAPAAAMLTGYITVLQSVPASARAAAVAAAARLHASILRSDDYPSLRPGYWVVYLGPYASAARAQVPPGGYVKKLG
jgi:stage II sporulation protein D